MFKVERLLQDDHAPVRVDDPRMRFGADALAGLVVPLEPHRHTGVHPVASALLVVPGTNTLAFTQVCLHFRLYLAMLKLTAKTVNGTKLRGRANK